jgi:hypothetical protein
MDILVFDQCGLPGFFTVIKEKRPLSALTRSCIGQRRLPHSQRHLAHVVTNI